MEEAKKISLEEEIKLFYMIQKPPIGSVPKVKKEKHPFAEVAKRNKRDGMKTWAFDHGYDKKE